MIALTFDDGYLEHYAYAKVLRALDVKATFYITTHVSELLGRKLLNIKPELIAEMADMGHEIGSHTCTHPDSTTIDSYKLIEELENSKKFLENITGREVVGFAYPYGRYNERVAEAVKKFYAYARSTELVGRGKELYNAPPKSLYELGAVPVFSLRMMWLPRFVWNAYLYKDAKPIAYTHTPSILKLILIVATLKSLGFNFVTVRQLFKV